MVVRPSLSYLSSQTDFDHSSFLNEYTEYLLCAEPSLRWWDTRGLHSSCPYGAYGLMRWHIHTATLTQAYIHHDRCSHVCAHTGSQIYIYYRHTQPHSGSADLCKYFLSLIHVWHTCPVYCPGIITGHSKVAEGSYFWSHIQSGLPAWTWLITSWPYGILLYKRGNVWPRDVPTLILLTSLLTLLFGINLSLETCLCPSSPLSLSGSLSPEGPPDSAPAFVFLFRMWHCLELGLCLCVMFAY